MTASRIFFYFCLSFIGGIFLSSFLKISQLLTSGILILGLIFISVLWHYKKLAVAGFCILFLILGIWRCQSAELKILNSELKKYNDLGQKITLTGIVSGEPDVREKIIKLRIENLKLAPPQNEVSGAELGIDDGGENDVPAAVLVTTGRYPEYKYGDKLEITGFLKTPENFEDFNYKNYLAKDGIYSVMNYPEIELLTKNNGRSLASTIYKGILELKDKLRENIYQNMSPPRGSILAALILGDKRQISDDWNQKLNYAGVRHITAVSGLHVAILSSILMSFLIGIGLWRQQSFYFAIILITLFIILTGLQPSAIRAGIMGGLFLFAQYLGRMNISFRTLVMAGAVMLAQNPLLLKLDVGFQLSFLAILGIIYIAPAFQNLFQRISGFLQFKEILTMTFSAQVFTLPILIYNFGYFSAVAPLTNVLILPILPLIMGLGFLSGLAGLIWDSLGWFFSLPVSFLLIYLTKVVDVFSKISWSVYVLEISRIWLIISYLILGFLAWRLNKKQKLRFFQH